MKLTVWIFFPRNYFVIWGDLFPWHGLNSTKPNEKQSRHQCSSRAQRKIISTDAWLNKWPSRSYVPTTSSITGNIAHTFALLFHCLKQTRRHSQYSDFCHNCMHKWRSMIDQALSLRSLHIFKCLVHRSNDINWPLSTSPLKCDKVSIIPQRISHIWWEQKFSVTISTRVDTGSTF